MDLKKFLKRFALALVISISIIGCAKNEDTGTPGTSDRDKFLGTWSVLSHHSQFADQAWDMTIVASPGTTNEILMDNFNQIGSGHSVSATISGSNISIPRIKYTTSTGFETIQGSGLYTNGKLSFNYTSDDGIAIDTVTATASRKQ